MKSLFVCLLIIYVFVPSCYYDSKENLYPQLASSGSCNDTINLTFSGTILPILNSNCSGCHDSSDPSGNVILTNYDDVIKVGTGKLMSSITHTGSASPMPKGGGKLDDCKIAAFQKWINEGALNTKPQ